MRRTKMAKNQNCGVIQQSEPGEREVEAEGEVQGRGQGEKFWEEPQVLNES